MTSGNLKPAHAIALSADRQHAEPERDELIVTVPADDMMDTEAIGDIDDTGQ